MVQSDLIKNPGIRFIIKFLAFFLGLNFLHDVVIGVTAPGGIYIPFVEHYFNYIAWIRHSILWGSMHISTVFGYQSYIDGPYHLRSVTGHSVQMVYKCIGLGVMSFWAAFVLAHAVKWKKKLVWTLSGIVIIWIINCVRVSIILAASVKKWNANKYLDHHDTFNIIAYICVFILIMLFIRKQGLHKVDAETSPQV